MIDAPISQVCIVDDDSDFVEFLSQYLGVRGLAATGFAAQAFAAMSRSRSNASAELAWFRLARYDIRCARLMVRVDFLAGLARMIASFDPTPLRDKVNVLK